jgi:hypothetical protein
MAKRNLVKLGSKTAKGGFRNEKDIVRKFNKWKNDVNAQKWLKIMGYDLQKVEKVKAVIIKGSHKTDIQAQITIYFKEAIATENLSVKLVSNPQGFNQIDKRWIDKYIQLWNIPQPITKALKLFTGEITSSRKDLRDPRRMFLDEMETETQNAIVKFFDRNKILIVSDILKGNDEFPAGWMLVALKSETGDSKWVLKHINYVLNFFGGGKIRITDKGSLKIGKITMQRKGGDGGRKTAQMLQFKINPALLFH